MPGCSKIRDASQSPARSQRLANRDVVSTVGMSKAVVLLMLALLICAPVDTSYPQINDVTVGPGAPSIAGESRWERSVSELREAGSAVARSELFDSDRSVAWTVHWPRSESERPPGVLVYVSPGDSGYLDPRWRDSLDRFNLALVSADNSGNEVLSAKRMALAILGLDVLRRERPIDPERIYVSGFSGGGQVASTLAALYPDLFRGGLYICGADAWEDDYLTDLDRLRKNRFVFLTGTRDFSRHSVRKVYRRYVEAGIDQSRLTVVPRMGHQHPDASDFAAAMAYLIGESDEPER